jgi:hypothetical protein
MEPGAIQESGPQRQRAGGEGETLLGPWGQPKKRHGMAQARAIRAPVPKCWFLSCKSG